MNYSTPEDLPVNADFGRIKNLVDGFDYEFVRKREQFLLREIGPEGHRADIVVEKIPRHNGDYGWIPRHISRFHRPGWKKTSPSSYGPFTLNNVIRADISVRLTAKIKNYRPSEF